MDKPLFSDLWAPLRSQLNPLRGLKIPRVVALLEAAGRGQYADLTWLYAHVERREHVTFALVRRRQSGLNRCTWRIELNDEAGDTGAIQVKAENQRDRLKQVFGRIDNLKQAWKWLGMATFRGFAHLEKHYGDKGEIIHLQPVPQWFWCRQWPQMAWLFNASAMNTNRGIEIAEEDFVIRELDSCIDELAAVDWVRKNLSIADWATYASTFGLPNIALEISREAAVDQAGMDALLQKLKYWVSNGRLVAPPGVTVKFLAGSSSDSTPFPGHVEYIDKMLVLAGTGGKLTMLSDATGIGQGATPAHEGVFEEMATEEADEIAEIMHRSIASPILAEEFPGEPELVRFVIERKSIPDRKAGADLLLTLKGAGWQVPEEQSEELVGLDLEPAPVPSVVDVIPEDEPADLARNRQSAGDDQMRTDVERVTGAVLDDTSEAMTALREALDIEDETRREDQLRRLVDRFPQLLQSANSTETASSILEKLLVQGVVEGLQGD